MPNSEPLIATLIANPVDPVLTPALADKAAQCLNASAIYWLADDIALDMPLKQGISQEEAYQTLFESLDGEPIDVVVQKLEKRRKKLLLADMDSTMIEQECIDELAEEAGLRDLVSNITKRAMNGEIAFEPALRERVALLKGLPLSIINKVINERISLMAGGRELVQTMKANGAYTALVSGGFTLFTSVIGERIGFNEHNSNELLHDGENLVGIVQEPILGKQAKLDKLLEICGRLHITPLEAMAVGDGANDLAMLQAAGSGVALHAKPVVAEAASMRIDYSDLTALLYIQGYRMADFKV
ncbi:phosphoserine phosphatase SerB [Bartonella sp. HY329]|uniref:phosphoserine phosphatase SerB n=1 Tax=unclassified Bartonella TaxID=2645622 RepID=UPI0021C7F17D|nr:MULTISPECIES: phosphoserine phosphatase SerB [unclassified Bartonella]UXM94506.1 phosphoserine phosphatase SerB [Bartonella sp. HY329]UXN08830.1 phosphoserine phosphatase SerB [Bartonella sp. HY328]